MTADDNELLRAAEVAAELWPHDDEKARKKRLYRLVASHHLPCVQVGRALFFRRAPIRLWLDANTINPVEFRTHGFNEKEPCANRVPANSTNVTKEHVATLGR